MHICCDYTIPVFELSTISEMPMNKASGFLYCDYLGCLLYNSSPASPIIKVSAVPPRQYSQFTAILSHVKSLPHTNYTLFSLKRLKSQIRHLRIEVTSPVLPFYLGLG